LRGRKSQLIAVESEFQSEFQDGAACAGRGDPRLFWDGTTDPTIAEVLEAARAGGALDAGATQPAGRGQLGAELSEDYDWKSKAGAKRRRSNVHAHDRVADKDLRAPVACEAVLSNSVY
jgi:hypothetical protein